MGPGSIFCDKTMNITGQQHFCRYSYLPRNGCHKLLTPQGAVKRSPILFVIVSFFAKTFALSSRKNNKT